MISYGWHPWFWIPFGYHSHLPPATFVTAPLPFVKFYLYRQILFVLSNVLLFFWGEGGGAPQRLFLFMYYSFNNTYFLNPKGLWGGLGGSGGICEYHAGIFGRPSAF